MLARVTFCVLLSTVAFGQDESAPVQIWAEPNAHSVRSTLGGVVFMDEVRTFQGSSQEEFVQEYCMVLGVPIPKGYTRQRTDHWSVVVFLDIPQFASRKMLSTHDDVVKVVDGKPTECHRSGVRYDERGEAVVLFREVLVYRANQWVRVDYAEEPLGDGPMTGQPTPAEMPYEYEELAPPRIEYPADVENLPPLEAPAQQSSFQEDRTA